jgi:hypothetical protein
MYFSLPKKVFMVKKKVSPWVNFSAHFALEQRKIITAGYYE